MSMPYKRVSVKDDLHHPEVVRCVRRVLLMLDEASKKTVRPSLLSRMNPDDISPYITFLSDDDDVDVDVLGCIDFTFRGDSDIIKRVDLRVQRDLTLHMFIGVFAHKMASLLMPSKSALHDEPVQDANYAKYYDFAYACVCDLFGPDHECCEYHRRAADSAARMAA